MWPTTWQPTLKGEAQAASSGNRSLLPIFCLEPSMGWKIPSSAFTPYSVRFGRQGRSLSWAGRTQTAQIPKAPYFSTKYILQTLQPPWNIPDLTFPPLIPSFWNTGPHSHGQSPSPALPGGETRSAQDETPRKTPPGLAVSPGWPPDRTHTPHPAPETHASPSLKRSSCLEQQKKEKKLISLFGVGLKGTQDI